MRKVILELTDEEAEKLDMVADFEDCGPRGETWPSPSMESLGHKIRAALTPPTEIVGKDDLVTCLQIAFDGLLNARGVLKFHEIPEPSTLTMAIDNTDTILTQAKEE